MRHSSINLTMNVDTDPRLLDVQAVVESLPSMSVTAEPNDNRQRIAAGAENLVAPNADFSGDSQSTAVTLLAISSAETFANSANAKAVATNEKTLAVTK